MAVITVDAISQRTILGGGDDMIVVSVRFEVMNSTVCLIRFEYAITCIFI